MPVYRGFLPPHHPACRDYSERRASYLGVQTVRPVWGWQDEQGTIWFYDPFEAERVIKWIERFCRHKKGEWRGKPFLLAPWQKRIIREIFGWFGRDCLRKIREAWIEIPRKNGKSTLVAALALYLMVADDEPAAEIFSVAGNEKQARLVYDDAVAMVELHPALAAIIEPLKKGMYHERSDSKFMPLGKGNQHGLNPHGVIGDEVHEWRGHEQYEAVTTADGTRRQPLALFITTAGTDLASLCGELHRTALQVKAGVLYRPDLFVAIFAADPGDKWDDPATWFKANPGLRHGAPKLSAFERAARAALESEAKKDGFKRLRLNIWTDGHTGWIPADEWAACRRDILWKELAGVGCYAGLDLAKVHDLSALSLLFEPSNPIFPGKWLLACRFWCPNEDIENRGRADGVDYKSWRERGLLTATPGATTDFDQIEREVFQIHQAFNIKRLGYDRFLAQQLIQHWEDGGIECVDVPQTIGVMGPPTAELQRMVKAGELYHGGHEIMGWNIGNTIVSPDANQNIRPNKAKSGKKIDGAIATINGLAVAMTDEHKQSAYESGREVLIV